MIKRNSFCAKLWMYFMFFAAIIFSLLWILQTFFLQSFYNEMLVKNTKLAAEKISDNIKSDEISEVIDQLAYDNSLIVFITETDGTIIYSSDSYKFSYHQVSTAVECVIFGRNIILPGKEATKEFPGLGLPL